MQLPTPFPFPMFHIKLLLCLLSFRQLTQSPVNIECVINVETSEVVVGAENNREEKISRCGKQTANGGRARGEGDGEIESEASGRLFVSKDEGERRQGGGR